jgi:hypothetical protein
MSLLLPGSTIESPKTIRAGTVSFSGILVALPAVLWKMMSMVMEKIMFEEEERGFWEGDFMVL